MSQCKQPWLPHLYFIRSQRHSKNLYDCQNQKHFKCIRANGVDNLLCFLSRCFCNTRGNCNSKDGTSFGYLLQDGMRKGTAGFPVKVPAAIKKEKGIGVSAHGFLKSSKFIHVLKI